jgi:hypothetical protein
MNKREDLTGNRYGRLLIIKRVKAPKHLKYRKGIYYLCKCDCGNESIVYKYRLINGLTKSCGCYKKEKFIVFKDLIGKKFGKLLVIERDDNDSTGAAKFLCKCDCGNEKVIRSHDLIRGKTISCGCYHKEAISLPNGEASFNRIYSEYKRRSKTKNVIFSISKKKFLEIITKNCFYCGSEPSNMQKNNYNTGDFIYNGIDRIDNNKGYTNDNVAPCCWKCNQAKHKMNIDEFYEWIDKIYEHKRGDSNG